MITAPKFPKFIQQARIQNHPELDAILRCGLPWMMLDLDPPKLDRSFTQAHIDRWFHGQHSDTTPNTEFVQLSSAAFEIDSKLSYGWKSRIIFGPAHWCEHWHLGTYEDEYNLSIKHRNDFEFEWQIPDSDPIRQWINSMFSDQDLLTVTAWAMPPGGYLNPHMDNTANAHGINNLYWAVQWNPGNEFGFYRFGNAPIQEGSVCLINNYSYPHWVVNNSDSDRLVLSIGADLSRIEKDIVRSWNLMHSLGRGNNPA
mgnify:CR=1 FL=1